METKANTALIGAFTLIVLALGFVFVYWLARGSEQGSTVAAHGRLPGSGDRPRPSAARCVFNGINVGEVKRLTLDPENPRAVIAEL